VVSEIKITNDGSATLYVPDLNEHYHSINGAVQESEHVFIGMGLKGINKKDVRVFEFGFGTGLNALLTLLSAKDYSIIYHTMELYPLSWSIVKRLGYEEFLGLSEENRVVFKKMHQTQWEKETSIRTKFAIKKINASILKYPLEENYDLVYYDAFAPDVQPELWDEEIFSRIYNSMNPDGRLVTYCAKGEVRRKLQRVGFSVERLPGPPGKWEMMRAVRPMD
jgi:tRNA U34 5-methylaminomethyl-2-thiouridine-forming methyltransferase MnmC